MTDLTDADRAEINRRTGGGISPIDESIYRAGLAAGRARAIEECAAVCMEQEIPACVEEIGLKPRSIYWQALTDCHAALRALNAASPES